MQKRRSENQAEEEIASNVGSTFTVVLLPGYSKRVPSFCKLAGENLPYPWYSTKMGHFKKELHTQRES